MDSLQLFSEQGALVGALALAVAALATVVVVLWKQNQALHRERAEELKESMKQALEREDKIHETLDKCEVILRASGQSRLPPQT